MGACITPHPHPQCPRESNMKSSAEGAVVCSENKRKDISSTGEGGPGSPSQELMEDPITS